MSSQASRPDDDDDYFYYVDSWHAIYRGALDLDPPLYTHAERDALRGI
jgi:hypothetical protein